MRVKPAGEWNTFEVTARGKTLTLWVNGAVTCQFEDCGAEKGRLGSGGGRLPDRVPQSEGEGASLIEREVALRSEGGG